ncbi:MAG: PhoPQ-activated pathogenicity-related family protein [Gemmataceae bacterium]|nr:PhoPQ-activated pathogenicity-related family protein [Gemmataceae bacterium]
MCNVKRRRWIGWIAVIGFVSPLAARADLYEYVKKPDQSFSWKLVNKTATNEGTIYDLKLVSQTWQGITWEHDLQVFLPKGVKPGGKMLLWNQGGKSSIASAAFGMQLATKAQAPVAFLFGIPNQPLFGDKTKGSKGLVEDALIAETFVRYLDTKDPAWPLLFPMVKSLVRAMDALQAFALQEWGVRIEGFIVSGASKRGWTAWLTAAADARVVAIAPLVIDTLNMPEQLKLQMKSYGKLSEQIKDYVQRGLAPPPDTADAKRLWGWVDPWNHRDRIKVPTMIINGANDPYWTVDSLNLYWNDLQQKKWVLYVPNAGHDLTQKTADGRKDRDRAIHGLVAFAKHIILDNPMPKLQWTHDDHDGKARLTAKSEPAALAARLWIAHAPTRDFRKSTWTEQRLDVRQGIATGFVVPPQQGYAAFFGELDFSIDGIRHSLSTQIRVLEAAKP